MLIHKKGLCHVSSVAHEGKVVLVATDKKGKLWYIVKQDGFEDSYLTQNPDERTGWEGWRELQLPNEDDDRSVIDREKREYTWSDNPSQYLLRSRYKSETSAVAPVQMVSTLGHLYIFRQSKENTLWVNRFVLDGLTNTLGLKVEVRFKRSRMRHEPINAERGDKASVIDSVDYTDINGNRFYEPTIELSLVQNLYNGWFSVVQLPTNEQDRYRWHIFAYNNESTHVELTSLLGTEDGLFQIKDHTVVHPELRTIPTVVQTTLNLSGDDEVSHGITATRYDVQRERETGEEGGLQLLKESVRVMLLVGTTSGKVKALDFAAAADGSLSRLSDKPGTHTLWRSDKQHLVLPVDTLDEVQAIGTTEPPPNGIVSGFSRGEKDGVVVESVDSTGLSDTEITRLKIQSNPDINKLYGNVSVIDANSFEVTRVAEESASWDVLPEQQSGLIFNGAVTAYRIMPNGNLRVSANNHQLESGDSVQVVDTQSFNGTYSVTPVDRNTFTLDGMRWQPGTIISARLASLKRRGILLGNNGGMVRIPAHKPLGESLSICLWFKMSEAIPPRSGEILGVKHSFHLSVKEGEGENTIDFVLPTENGLREVKCKYERITGWMHLAVTYDGQQLNVYVNGKREGETKHSGRISSIADGIDLGRGHHSLDWDHQIAELSLWSSTRSEAEIGDSQYIPVKGDERDLIGYWPLNSIVEGSPRTTVDMSRHGRHGVVLGGAFVGNVELHRNLPQSDIEAIKYVNNDLVAVTERATYLEQFEFKTDADTQWDNSAAAPFAITCSGKRSRYSQDWTELAVEATQITPAPQGWYLASVQYTVPDGVSLIRAFGIEQPNGDWTSLKIRKHQIARISDRVSLLRFSETMKELPQLGSSSREAQEPLATIRRLEPIQVQLQTEQRRLQLEIKELESFRTDFKQDKDQFDKDRRVAEDNVELYEKLIPEQIKRKEEWEARIILGKKKAKLYSQPSRSGNSFQRAIGRYSTMPDGWNDNVMSLEVPDGLYLTLYEHTNFRGGNDQFLGIPNLRSYDITEGGTSWSNEASSFVVGIRDGGFESLDQLKANRSSAQKEVDRLNKKLQLWTQKLDKLRNPPEGGNLDSDLQKAKEEKDSIDDELKVVTSKLDVANGEFSTLRTAPPMAMQSVYPNSSQDQPLVTRGGDLNFIRLASRPTAVESCLGQVRLNYMDKSGCIKQATYDATADSANASFEQWLTDGERHCLYVRGKAVVTLDVATPNDLTEWTIEAWVYYSEGWHGNGNGGAGLHALAELGSAGEYPVVVDSSDVADNLGVRVGTKFHSCGFNMRELEPGWQHIATVATGSGTKGSQRFFVNGKQVGKSVAVKATKGIKYIGNNRAGNSPFGRIAEFKLWNEALSVEEIKASSQQTATGTEPGLRLYLPFDEGRGNIANDKTGQYKATIAGPEWWAFTGQIGKIPLHALTTDGSSSYAEFPHAAKNNPKEFTVSCWARCTGGEGQYRSPLTSRQQRWMGYMFYAGSNNRWQFWVGNGSTLESIAGPAVELNKWVHLCATYLNGQLTLYVDGKNVAEESVGFQANTSSPLRIGAGSTEGSPRYFFPGQVAEVCIWKTALSHAQVVEYQHRQVNGSEKGLNTCIRMYGDSDSVSNPHQKPTDIRNKKAARLVSAAKITSSDDLPIGREALVSAEYSTVGPDKTAMMRRLFASVTGDGVQITRDQRIDLLDLRWIGNGQFAPTLLGFMEGPPPVPSENLTIEDDYRSYISVALNLTEDVSFNWTRSQDAGLGASIDAFIGADVTQTIVAAPLGVGVLIDAVDVRAGFKGNLDFSYQFQNESSITSSNSLSMTDSLKMVGTQEQIPRFGHLGKRFIPKNVGYALVVSSMADVFVTRLLRSRTMIGYQVMPVENIPPDVNTITFLINPAYTMTGSLDGMTGSSATSERFHKHVPAMRSHMGSKYPASYYRLDEAYALKQQIEQTDKNREAYFTQYNSLSVSAAAIDQDFDAAGQSTDGFAVNGNIGSEVGMTQEEKDAAAKKREAAARKLEENTEKRKAEEEKKASAKRVEIAKRIDDQSQRSHANASFAAWQKKMENIQLKSGKRNIVNTYVWDADGGFRSESQSFANSAEHSIGGSFSLNAGLGAEANFNALGASVELTAQATVNMTQTMSKTESRSQGVSLDVDIRGVESRGVTDHHDNPIMPGEKVNRYRFMSFYLEGSTDNFNDFFSTVVDPEWLAGNSEEARALRESRGKPNKCWRVLHRVTYVERPALQGFGQDHRNLPSQEDSSSEVEQIKESVERLEKNNEALQKKIDAILKRLTKPS